MAANKGFITVATGKDRYYIMAHNLLRSYRFHAKSPMPFAIICDRANEWTADFDSVVIVETPTRSYMDKMRILDLSPFDETLFVDADSLAFRDLNEMWSLFEDSPDVGVVGVTFPLDSKEGWWDVKNLGELQNKVDYKMICQGGVYYVRKCGKELPGFIDTCRFIEQHYSEYHFRVFGAILADEPIMSLASCVHHYMPLKHWTEIFAYYPYTQNLSADIVSGHVAFNWTESPEHRFMNSFLIHFGTVYARHRWLYKREVFKLKRGPVGLSNLWDYLLLWSNHNWHKLAMTFFRIFKIKRKIIMEVYE